MRNTPSILPVRLQLIHLGLIIYSKRVNAVAELAIAEAVKIEELRRSESEAERQKKQTDDLEAARQKNRKIFRP